MILNFICGCTHEINPVDQEDVGWWKEVATDSQGFLVCVKHRLRRKCWNSLPENDSRRPKFAYLAFSPLQRERSEIFGASLPSTKTDFDFSGEDRRDNRDPEQIGKAILARHNGE